MASRSDKRTSNRVSLLKPTQIKIKGRLFTVHDISHGGMGILLEEGGPHFFMGERLQGIPLPLAGGIVPLEGVVSHISVTDEKQVCGIRFILHGDDFDAVIQFRKERMVEDSQKRGRGES